MVGRRNIIPRRDMRADVLQPDDLERRLNRIVSESTAKIVERAKKIVAAGSKRHSGLDAQA